MWHSQETIDQLLRKFDGPLKRILGIRYPESTGHFPGPPPEISPPTSRKKLANPIPNSDPNPNPKIDTISKFNFTFKWRLPSRDARRGNFLHPKHQGVPHPPAAEAGNPRLGLIAGAISCARLYSRWAAYQAVWLQCSVRQSSVITDQSDAAAAPASFLTYLADDRRRSLPC